jgi:hypothetical protein
MIDDEMRRRYPTRFLYPAPFTVANQSVRRLIESMDLTDWQRDLLGQFESLPIAVPARSGRRQLYEVMLAMDMYGASLNETLDRRRERMRRMRAAYPRRWRKL